MFTGRQLFNKNPSDDGSGRGNIKQGRVLNTILLIALLTAFVIIIGRQILHIIALNNITLLSPFFFRYSGFIISYTLLLAGGVMLLRSHGKKNSQAGGERRRQLLLRYTLNFLMAAPVIGLIAAFIIRALSYRL